ncbi:MAG: winged helix-turn-helix domain-containing protein [Desulfobulbaceae bacterium]|nr:winged helix-turn-helix domain-containing protein [Desulfobulbaceae bacterium]
MGDFFKAELTSTPQKTPYKESLRGKIIALIAEDQHISQKGVADKLDISFYTVKEYFGKLKEEGRIKRVGGRKNGLWIICD